MAKKTFSIGSNLATAMTETALIAHEHSGELHIEAIPISRIELDPENPRNLHLSKEDALNGLSKSDAEYAVKQSEIESLHSLSESIISQGLINPVLVYKTPTCYRLVAGERRLLASVLAKKDTIQAKILDKKPNKLKLSLLQWIENMERSDLSLAERISNIKQILDALKQESPNTEITGYELAKTINISKAQAYNYLKVFEMSPDIIESINSGVISNLDIAVFVSQTEEPIRSRLLEMCKAGFNLQKLRTAATELQATKTIKSAKGRPSEKIDFCKSKSTHVAKLIAESILHNPKCSHHAIHFEAISWDDKDQINKAFKKLISALEKELK